MLQQFFLQPKEIKWHHLSLTLRRSTIQTHTQMHWPPTRVLPRNTRSSSESADLIGKSSKKTTTLRISRNNSTIFTVIGNKFAGNDDGNDCDITEQSS